MKVKKTIAAIAAAALTVSAISLAALATDEANAGGGAGGDTTTTTAATTESGSEGAPAAAKPTANGATGNVNNDTISGTGSASISTEGDVINVNVTLTPADGDIGGQPQNGAADGQKNYHLTIPMTGDLTGWTLTTANGGQYTADNPEHPEWNVDNTNGAIKLWVPVANGECKVVLVKDGQYVTLVIKTQNGTATVVTEPEVTEPEVTEPEVTEPEVTEPEETTPPEDEEPEEEETEDVIPSAGELPSLTPGASSSSGAAGADTVASTAEISASRNPNLTVNADDTPVSTEMVTAFVKNNAAKTMTLSYGSALKIAVDKDDISDAAAANLDFSVSGKNFLNTKTIEANEVLSNATKIVQIDFVNEGKIEGVDKVTIKSKVGVKLAGKTVTIFEYVDGKLVKLGTGEVTASGYVKFKTDHLGQFVIAVE